MTPILSRDAAGDALSRDQHALAAHDNTRPVLLEGAVVLSMDPSIGDLERGDVLIRDGHIAAVGTGLSNDPRAHDAIVLDCSRLILLPGFQDTHRHAWQNQLRRFLPDVDQDGYLTRMHARLAHHYQPEDMYAGNMVSALGALDAGITTMLDFSHNARTAEHSDAAIDALADTGIRAVHASAAPFNGMWDKQWPDDLVRLADRLPTSGLITLRMGLLPKVKPIIPDILAMSEGNVRLAREMGIAVSVDGVFGAHAAREICSLHTAGLLGPDIALIHCTDLNDDAWRAIVDSGAQVSLCPTSDAQVGIESGVSPIQTCLDLGLSASLSVDVEVCLAPDMFSQMRALLTIQRMNVFTRRTAGDPEAPALLTDRQVLEFATIGGARANGLEASTGSLTPGKAADIIGIRTDDVNVFPLNNAVGTVVQGADSRNIECVFVAGRPVKWQREVVSYDLGRARRIAEESRDRLFRAAGITPDVLA
ncbi:amidohydrolase family protein [Streptomyces sp. NPDC060205]|uniref:amidohydrolase family protein n=1 Tax=Streptomyces sp. NPDC060205 TaxID=3347072 RepID=UPI003669E359